MGVSTSKVMARFACSRASLKQIGYAAFRRLPKLGAAMPEISRFFGIVIRMYFT